MKVSSPDFLYLFITTTTFESLSALIGNLLLLVSGYISHNENLSPSFTTTSTGTCTLTNDDVPVATLGEDPIVITDASTTIQVKHQDHHMYDVVNNVTIDKVSSGLTTTLASAITSTETTIDLTSNHIFYAFN